MVDAPDSLGQFSYSHGRQHVSLDAARPRGSGPVLHTTTQRASGPFYMQRRGARVAGRVGGVSVGFTERTVYVSPAPLTHTSHNPPLQRICTPRPCCWRPRTQSRTRSCYMHTRALALSRKLTTSHSHVLRMRLPSSPQNFPHHQRVASRCYLDAATSICSRSISLERPLSLLDTPSPRKQPLRLRLCRGGFLPFSGRPT